MPLVLWDGDNLTVATDGTYLTAPADRRANLFNYRTKAEISVVLENQEQSGTKWVQGSNNFATGETPLVMFYFWGRSRSPCRTTPQLSFPS